MSKVASIGQHVQALTAALSALVTDDNRAKVVNAVKAARALERGKVQALLLAGKADKDPIGKLTAESVPHTFMAAHVKALSDDDYEGLLSALKVAGKPVKVGRSLESALTLPSDMNLTDGRVKAFLRALIPNGGRTVLEADDDNDTVFLKATARGHSATVLALTSESAKALATRDERKAMGERLANLNDVNRRDWLFKRLRDGATLADRDKAYLMSMWPNETEEVVKAIAASKAAQAPAPAPAGKAQPRARK